MFLKDLVTVSWLQARCGIAEGTGQRTAAHIMVTRKRREKQGSWEGDAHFQARLPVTHFQLGPAS